MSAMTLGDRWEWEYPRQRTGGLLTLDVRALERAGALRPGAVHWWGWTRGRDPEPAGDIMVRMNRAGDCLTLDYKSKWQGDIE